MGDGGQSTMVVRRRQRQCVVLAWGRCGLTRKVRLELCSREVQQCMLEAREREKEQLKAGIQGKSEEARVTGAARCVDLEGTDLSEIPTHFLQLGQRETGEFSC